MATYYLMNNVQVGTNFMYAGTLIDSLNDDVAGIQDAGGQLVDSSEPTVAAAAAVAQSLRKRGADPIRVQSVMVAARDASLDTVGGTVAVNQTTIATNQNSAEVHHETIANIEAPATSYGTIADDAASANATGQPTHPTTLDCVFAAGYDGGDVTVHGTAPDGTAITEVFAAGDGVTRNGTTVFALLDAAGSFTSTGTGVGSELATIQSAADVGLAKRNATVVKVSEDGVNAAFTQAAGQITAGSFTPTSAKDGAVDYDVWYTTEHTHVQDTHNHTQTSHTHSLS